jgi:23S rRNA (cytosine1962-C5)-methyltransferase
MENLKISKTLSSKDYELLDSGEGEKLERYGDFIISRPDPQALWRKGLSNSEWQKSSADFSRDETKGKWIFKKELPEKWPIELYGLKFWVKLSPFKHTGVFPEQVSNWNWIEEKISGELAQNKRKISVLNLFGYTGGATLAASKAGAEVCHVDGSRASISWARENSELSGLGKNPIRWILEDARTFVQRELRRGNKYDAIIMDPPAFGHGPKKEVWKIEDDLIRLVKDCTNLLSDFPLFFIINGYSSGYSAIAYENILKGILEKFGGEIEKGELAIEESQKGRLLPAGIFGRWQKSASKI